MSAEARHCVHILDGDYSSLLVKHINRSMPEMYY